MTPEDANRRFRSLRAMVGYVRGPKFLLDPDTILRVDHVRLELDDGSFDDCSCKYETARELLKAVGE
jgi:hypothetical protein